jgi:hypothetical protein
VSIFLPVACSAFSPPPSFSLPALHHHHHVPHPAFGGSLLSTPTISETFLIKKKKKAVCRLFDAAEDAAGGSSDSILFGGGEVGSGPNWIERSFPVDTTDGSSKIDPKKVDDYNLGISGISFGTGPLSQRMHNVMTQKSSVAKTADPSSAAMISTEVQRGFLLYAMDFTAKEAVRAALLENGLELVLSEDEEDEGMWGEIDLIRLLNDGENESSDGVLYDSWLDAIGTGNWTPGQAFSFVARNVPAKMRELTMDELLQALDPQGELRQQAHDKGMYMPDIVAIKTLQDMANENVRRTELTPREAAVSEDQAYSGMQDQRGYQVIPAKDLLIAATLKDDDDDDDDETAKSKRKTILHVMDALVSHGSLIVDVTNGGTDMEDAKTMAAMWNTVEAFYEKVDAAVALEEASSSSASNDIGSTDNDDMKELIASGMRTALETGSPHAKVGFASYDSGNMQFLETRWDRQEGSLWPREAQSVLNSIGAESEDHQNSVSSLKAAFDLVAAVTKNIVRLAVATSTLEAAQVDMVADTTSSSSWRTRAFQAAELLSNEIVDDAKPLDSSIENSEGSVSMSPHRLCRYSNKGQQPQQQQPQNDLTTGKKKKTESPQLKSREIFGAHTDSTFITAVPVAAVSGLEVFDEDAEQWYRPELMARKHYHQQNDKNRNEPTSDNDSSNIPWYARYFVCLPGELLQLTTRNEIMAAVHRVVATENGPSRLSAPMLIRGRPGTRLGVNRYLLQEDILLQRRRNNDRDNDGGDNDEDNYSLLEDCNGMTIEQIHDAMQPTSFQ